MIAIEAQGVKKSFRQPASVRLLFGLKLRGAEVVALDGFDAKVQRGSGLGLMGPNGAGKSTLLRILAGLLLPSAGRVVVEGHDATRAQLALRRSVGYVAADERGLTPHLSPREHLAFFAALHGMERKEALCAVDRLIERMGLTGCARRPLRELSTGMRRRTALARGLIGTPRVLLLDEPTRGVDPAGMVALHAELRALLDGGCTLVLATHDREEARSLCAEVAVLDGAKLVAIESPDRASARLLSMGAAVG